MPDLPPLQVHTAKLWVFFSDKFRRAGTTAVARAKYSAGAALREYFAHTVPLHFSRNLTTVLARSWKYKDGKH